MRSPFWMSTFFISGQGILFAAIIFPTSTIAWQQHSPPSLSSSISSPSSYHDYSIEKTKKDDEIDDAQRRRYLNHFVTSGCVGRFLLGGLEASASNLPESTGVDLSNVGTIETLIPILAMKSSLDQLKLQLVQSPTSTLTIDTTTIPSNELTFKRIFDAYSDPVSYKQKFLDQNAFLVYYTKGFDGPGRPNIEADVNLRQTEQFGLRNEAWIAWHNFLDEVPFLQDPDNDCLTYLNDTIRAIDAYILLAPPNDVKTGKTRLGLPLS